MSQSSAWAAWLVRRAPVRRARQARWAARGQLIQGAWGTGSMLRLVVCRASAWRARVAEVEVLRILGRFAC
eukprot:8196630-Heterocapsa_arctica.AAC.1